MNLQSPTAADWQGYERFRSELEERSIPRPYACLGMKGMIGIRTLTADEADQQNYLFCQHGDPFRYVALDEFQAAQRVQVRRQSASEIRTSGLFVVAVLGISALTVIGTALWVFYVIAGLCGVTL